jgi:hypothetical protein
LLKFPDFRDADFLVLAAFEVLAGELAELEVDLCELTLLQFEVVVQGFQHLLLHLIEKEGRVLGEGLREGGGFEGLVVPDLGGQQQNRHKQSASMEEYLR